MSSRSFNWFSTVVGVLGSLISIFGLARVLRYESHLPAARLAVLQNLLHEILEEGDLRQVDLDTEMDLQQLGPRSNSAYFF